MNIRDLLSYTIKNNASDLHFLIGDIPTIRVDGNLIAIPNYPPLTKEMLEEMVYSILTPEQKELLITNKELDFSLSLTEGGEMVGRFRINAYYQRGGLAVAFRYLPPKIRSIEELGLPPILHNFANLKQGFILVTGPTGHGKSTTLAAVLLEINTNRSDHILTIEDPIEYIYPKGKGIISQREMSIDTHSWTLALKAALREDPDVVLVGEMRDPETMAAAITIAETGHLVFSTLHTNSAADSINRIVDSFPSHQQGQIRIQLAATLKGIVSNRLLPRINGGRVPAAEILIGTPAVANNIREAKTHLIDSIIQTSQDIGMITMDASLASLVMSGVVSLEVAKTYALHEQEFLRMVS